MTPPNLAPTTRSDEATTTTNTTIAVDVVANDFDRNGDDQLTLISAKRGNTRLPIADNKVLYTPLSNFVGEELIAYKIADQGGKETKGKLFVTVTEATAESTEFNFSPVARSDRAETTINTLKVVDVLANDFDRNAGDTLTLISAKRGNTRLEIMDNKVVYKPLDGFTGEELITYIVADDRGKESKGRLFVTVTGEAISDAITGSDQNDVLHGDETDNKIFGFGGKDYLAGRGGNDTIDGGAGIDTIIGGADTGSVMIDADGNAKLMGGGDMLTGGTQGDFFKYTSGHGADYITDFENDVDKLVLKGAHSLVDVTNGTFVDFGANQGVIVAGISSADLANDIIDVTMPVA